MIARLRGRLVHRDTASLVVDVHGVGYLVHVTPGERLPARGEEVELHTSLQVREESMTLYGFADPGSLRLFDLLLTSSGVGPKLALAALGTHRPDVLRGAISGGDLATLTQVPGIGKKVAERLVLELRDKVGGESWGPGAEPGAEAGAGSVEGGEGPAGVRAEVREALTALGYGAAEIQRALTAVDPTEATTTERLLRSSLRVLGRAALDGARS